MTVETALLNNQSILQNFGFGEEIDEQTAEIISGGKAEIIPRGDEVFSIRNNTNLNITHVLDGTTFQIKPGEEFRYIAHDGGIIKYDPHVRANPGQIVSNDLENGRIYEFQYNRNTTDDLDDIILVSMR